MKLPTNYNLNADILRVLAGFGVVLIHVTDPFLIYPPFLGVKGVFWEFLYMINGAFRFSVPMFILISGMFVLKLSKSLDFGKFYSKRFARVGIPTVFWIGVHMTWVHFRGTPLSGYDIATMLVGANLDYLYFMVVISTLYFIAPLFIVFFSHTHKNIHKYVFITATLYTLLIVASGVLLPETLVDTAASAFTIFLPFLSYFIAGFYLKDKKLPKLYTLPFITLIGLITITITLLSNGDFTHYTRHIGSITVLTNTYLIFLLVMQSDLLSRLKKYMIPTQLIRFAAVSTFGVYLVHILVINVFDIVVPSWTKASVTSISATSSSVIIAKVFIIYLLCVLVTTLGRRIPYVKAVFGE